MSKSVLNRSRFPYYASLSESVLCAIFSIMVLRREDRIKRNDQKITTPAYIGMNLPTRMIAKSENKTIGCHCNGEKS